MQPFLEEVNMSNLSDEEFFDSIHWEEKIQQKEKVNTELEKEKHELKEQAENMTESLKKKDDTSMLQQSPHPP